MNHLKTNPVGIDKVIDRIQKLVHDPLLASWGSLDVYGRVYKVKKEDEITLRRYIGNNEYEPILFSEGNKIFFVQGDNPETNLGEMTNDLWMICIVKVDSTDERNDEEIHEEVLTLLSGTYLKNITGVEYGMSNLRRVVEDSSTFASFRYSDIHPYHVFMVQMSVNYSLIKDNC